MKNTLTQPVPTQADTPRWPDDAPAVSFDIGLGQDFGSISVDPLKFSAMLTEMGVPNTDQAQLDVLISRRAIRRRGTNAHTNGHEVGSMKTKRGLLGDKHKITVAADTTLENHDLEDVNEMLRHESQHFADEVSGVSREIRKRDDRDLVRNLKQLGFLAVGALSGGILGRAIAGKDGAKIGAAIGGNLYNLVGKKILDDEHYARDELEERARAMEPGTNLPDYGQVITAAPKK